MSCCRAAAHRSATIHIHKPATTKREFCIRQPENNKQTPDSPGWISHLRHSKHTAGRGAQNQSTVAWTWASLFTGTKVILFPFAAWHGHPWLTAE